jgi:hypothetical protein
VAKGKPTFRDIVASVKGPKTVVPVETCYPERPAWRVSLLEMVDPFGWHELSADKLQDIRSKLAGIEGNTWKDILVRDAKYNHFIAVDKICPEARERLQALHLDDIDSLLSLRLAGAERIWGILQLNVLQVLWWDPEHLVYPVNIANN